MVKINYKNVKFCNIFNLVNNNLELRQQQLTISIAKKYDLTFNLTLAIYLITIKHHQ